MFDMPVLDYLYVYYMKWLYFSDCIRRDNASLTTRIERSSRTVLHFFLHHCFLKWWDKKAHQKGIWAQGVA